MDIQHVLNHVYSKKFIDGYNKINGLSIVLSSREHYVLSKKKNKDIYSLKNYLEKKLIILRNYTDVNEEIIQSIKKKINDRYLANMNPKYFVEILRKVVQEQSVNDTIENLEEPPGKNPPSELKELSLFFNGLSEKQKETFKKVLHQTAEMTFFGMLCVLDGVRVIESGDDKGSLELWYRKGEDTMLLNDPDEEYLHDLI